MNAVALLGVLLAAPPTGTSARTDAQLTLDGRLDEPAWQEATFNQVERQKEPNYGASASARTEWKALVTDETIYIGIVAHYDGIAPVARRTRRDRGVETDRITVDLDTRGRGKDAFHFEVTAGGSLVDGIRYNDTDLDLQWDSYWQAAVSKDDDAWTVEIEIPTRILRRPPKSTAPITIQVRRYISALGETDEWAPTPRDYSREVSAYGPVNGMALRGRKFTADVLPYVTLGGTVNTQVPNPLTLVARGGADAKLQVGPDVTIDATVYPDFGTVEADTAVFNLNPVEVRFPEKRPFFLEGTDVLATPLELFYSRRIGSLTGRTAGAAIELPPPAPVLGAAKLLARAGKKWSFAGIVGTTNRQDVVVRDVDAAGAPQRIAPVYTYAVARAIRDLPNAGYVGLLGTTRFSFDPGPLEPWDRCPSGDAPGDGACFADVYTFGPDLRLRSKDGGWVAEGQLVGTYRQGGPASTYPDGLEASSGEIGGAGHVRVDKVKGRVVGWARYTWYGRNADWNATGFLQRPNHHFARAHLAYRTLNPHGVVLEDRWQLEVWQRVSLDGIHLGHGYQANYRAKWKSFWRSFTEIHWRPKRYDNREARDGTGIERAGYIGLEQTITTDHRRAAVGNLEGVYQQRLNGATLELELTLDLNILGPFQIRIGAEGTLQRGEPRWVGTDTDRGVHQFARLDARSLGVLSRVNYTITPRLELQLYAQVLAVGTIFDEGFTAPIQQRLIDLAEMDPDPTFEAVSQSQALFVANAFLRWEFAPGSNLYLVATRDQLGDESPEGEGRLDLRGIGQQASSYTFLTKVVFLLGRQR